MSKTGTSKQKFVEGDKITVHFEPSDPATCYIKEEIETAHFIGVVISILGGIVVIFSFFNKGETKKA